MKLKQVFLLTLITIAANISAVEYYCNWQVVDKEDTLSYRKAKVSSRRTDDCMDKCVQKAWEAVGSKGEKYIVWMEKLNGNFERGAMFTKQDTSKMEKVTTELTPSWLNPLVHAWEEGYRIQALWGLCYDKPTADCGAFQAALNPTKTKSQATRAEPEAKNNGATLEVKQAADNRSSQTTDKLLSDALKKAIDNYNFPAVKKIFSDAPQPAVSQKLKNDALLYAAGMRDLDAIKLILQAGANIKAKDGLGHTVLMNLVEGQFGGWPERHEIRKERPNQLNLAAVTYLVEHGSDANASCVYAQAIQPMIQILTNADNFKHMDIARYLISKGMDVNAVEHYADGGNSTALHEAARYGFTDTVKTLLELGADAQKSVDGKTAYDLAKLNGHTDVMKMLAGPTGTPATK